MTQHDKIKQILDTLNNLQENLLSLPDDMLLSIYPVKPAASWPRS